MSDQPHRNADGTVKKGGPSLNKGGRPRKLKVNYHDRAQIAQMVLRVAERTAPEMTKEAVAKMPLGERNIARLAMEGASGNVQAATAFGAHLSRAVTFLEFNDKPGLHEKIALLERQLEAANAALRHDAIDYRRANKQLAAERATIEARLKAAHDLIDTLRADLALAESPPAPKGGD